MDKIGSMLKKIADKRRLLEYLQKYMTEERSSRFNTVLAYRTRHFTIAVEDVFQERNASAIVRTADCFGIQDVYIIENHNEYRLSEGISKGADKWVDVKIYDSYSNNTLKCIGDLRKKGYQIMATTPHEEECTLESFDISEKTAFFLGGEKEGLTETVKEEADGFLRIPMFGFTESYNISVAGALLLYSLTRRLHQSNITWGLSPEEKLDLQVLWTIKTIASAEHLIRKFLEVNP